MKAATKRNKDVLCATKRPVHTLLHCLLSLHATSKQSSLDAHSLFAQADDALLDQIAASADVLQRAIHIGTAAIGRCLALSADGLDTLRTDADNAEALGWFVAEISELGALSHQFEVAARRILRERKPP
jgi:hypothetical protein